MSIRRYDFNVETETDEIPVATDAMQVPVGTTAQRPSGTAGLVRLNSQTNKYEAYNNNAWVELSTLNGSENLSSKTLVEPVIDNFADFNEESAPSSPSAGKLRVYAKADKKLYKKDSDGLESEVGSGSGGSGRNYLADWFDGTKAVGTVTEIITNITPSPNWKSSDNTKLTIANVTSGGLREGYSLKLDHDNDGEAFVQTPEFVLDTVDLGKPVTVMFDHGVFTDPDDYQVYMVRYNSSGTYQESIPISGTASATSPNSARIPAGSVGTFQGFFIARSEATDLYALRFYRNNALDTADILIDSLYVGPQQVVQGAAITDWTSYTPSNTQGFGTITNSNLEWCRSGPNMFIRGYFTSGTVAASEAQIGLPNNNVIAGAGSASVPVGDLMRDSSITGITQTVLITPGDSFLNFGRMTAGAGTNNLTPVGGSTLVSSTERIAFFAGPIPIVGWSSNVTLANRAVEEYASNSDTSGTDDTTSFAYGASGNLVPNRSVGTEVKKRVRFQTPIQPTDAIILEVLEPSAPGWNTWSDRLGSWMKQGPSDYGVYLDWVNATDIDVRFSAHGYSASNATYAGNGSAFSALFSSGFKWRVRKVSGGASVGYPVSARNVVGDTSGTAVPSGFIGEFKTLSVAFAYSATNGWKADTVNSMVLTKGTWLVYVDMFVPSANAVNHFRCAMATNNSSNNTGTISNSCLINRFANTTLTNGDIATAAPLIYYAASDTTVYGKFFVEDSETVNLSGNLYAVRIA